MTHYCANCANTLGLRPEPPTTDFLATQYQREKHLEHTVPDSSHGMKSVFDEGDMDYFTQTVQEAYKLGDLEVESRGTNILFCPSAQSTIGFQHRFGDYVRDHDTVKVVKTGDSDEVHAYPVLSSSYSSRACQRCGGPLLGQ